MKLTLRLLQAQLRAPFSTAHGSVRARELLLLELAEPGGPHGFGEAAPLASYDGVSPEDVGVAFEDCRDALEAATLEDACDAAARSALIDECRRRAVLPQALAAIELALFDLAGRAAGLPVSALLGAENPSPVSVNWTISAPDRTGAAREADFARQGGYHVAKLKVGTGDDAARLAAARAAGGSGLALRLDANGAWTPDEAVRWLDVLAPAGIELCEEPTSGISGIERVAEAVGVPVAIDESAADPAALTRRACAAICLKVSRCGGIAGVIDAAAQARALGYEVYLASSLDGPLGIAAALHAAAIVAPDRACGLATLPMFDRRPDPLPAHGGSIAVPAAPGLGDELERWYR